MRLARHGDLLIRKTKDMPSGLKLTNTKILAEGGKTGHKYQLEGDVFVYGYGTGLIYFEVKNEAKLIHQEHKTIQIAKGIYMVRQEREFNPFENMRRVVLDWLMLTRELQFFSENHQILKQKFFERLLQHNS